MTDVRLTEDLSCIGTAITVGADGIEIDLAGHTLSVEDPWTEVVVNRRHAVTVRDGTLAGNLEFEGSVSATLTGVTVVGGRIRLGNEGFIHKNRVVNGWIYMDTGSRLNLIQRNSFEDAGISMDGGYNTILDNVIRYGSISNLEGGVNSVIGNTLYQGSIRMTNAVESGGMIVQDNRVVESPEHGIYFACRRGSYMASITRNQVIGSARHGILTGEYCSGNVALTANQALRNGQCGIYAPGAVDGGRNKAKGNAEPEQCVGISCN